MTLTPSQRRQVVSALVDAFPRMSALRQLVDLHLETRLTDIAGDETPLRSAAFNLLEWAESHGQLNALLHAALSENSGNAALQAVATELGIGTAPTNTTPPHLMSQSAAPPTVFQCRKYLERLQAYLLDSFRQDQYMMLTVKERAATDLISEQAIQEASYETFGIRVKAGGREGREAPLEEAIADQRLVALLGDPGSGKTTALQSVALGQIKAFRANTQQQLPVWVSLGNWSDQASDADEFLWDTFHSLWAGDELSRDTFMDWLEHGHLLVLLDGLNELPQRKLEKLEPSPTQPRISEASDGGRILDPRENSLLALARESDSRFVLSCRVSEYTYLPGWREFCVLPMSDAQIDEFIQKHRAPDSQFLDTLLEQQPQIKDLFRNPFYLRCVVLLDNENYERIPTDRFQVVKYTCRAAVRREAKRRQIDVVDVMRVLGEDAADSMLHGYIGSGFITFFDLDSDDIGAVQCAEGAGLLLRVGKSQKSVDYHYMHQLIQEALALIYLEAEKFKEEAYPEARSLAEVGEYHLHWGKRKEAEENLKRALELCPTVGVESLRAEILLKLSSVYRIQHRSRMGLEYAQKAIQLLDCSSDTLQVAETCHILGVLYERLRETKKAEACYLRAIEIYERLGEKEKYAYEILFGLADLYASRKVYKIPLALRWYEKSWQSFEEQGNELGVARTKLEMAWACQSWGVPDRGLALCKDCAVEFDRLKQPDDKVRSLRCQGSILTITHQFSEAEKLLNEALTLAKEIRSPTQFNILVNQMLTNVLYRKMYERARELLIEAEEIVKRKADPNLTLDIIVQQGLICFMAKEFHEATEYWLRFDKEMDEEYQLHLALEDRLAIRWAKTLGVGIKKSLLARMLSSCILSAFLLFIHLTNYSHWIGRRLIRIYGWLNSL